MIPRWWFGRAAPVLLALAIGVPAGAQTPPPPPLPSEAVPTNLEQIKKSLEQESLLQLNKDRLRFYVSVVAEQPTMEKILGKYDLRFGPTPGGGMTHQEFLNLVTPRELYGSAGITARELLQGALVNFFGQMLLKRAFEDLRNAKTEREVQEIRERIDRELAALRVRGGG